MTTYNDPSNRVLIKQTDYLSIAKGQIAGHSVVAGSGYSSVISTTTTASTIWTGNSLYVYPPAATVMTLSSSSALDTVAGTGARTVHIRGLDASYNRISEVVALNGQTAVSTVNSYLRVFGINVLTAGSLLVNQGVLYAGTGTVTAGVPATKYAIANLGDNASFIASYTVPAGFTGFIAQAVVSIGKGKDTEWSTWVAPFGMVMRKARNGYLFESTTVQINNIPLVAPEKTDVELRGKSVNANTDMSINFDFVLVDNNYL